MDESPRAFSAQRLMHGWAGKRLRFAAFVTAGLIGTWTALACHRARQFGEDGSELAAWTSIAVVFLTFALVKLAQRLGWLKGWGNRLRRLAKREHVYATRRAFQIVATALVASSVAGLVLYGLAWHWDGIKQYRLAGGFAGFAVGYVVIRFISLHEVDSWIASHPWLPTAVELIAGTGASAAGLARLSQLEAFARLWGTG